MSLHLIWAIALERREGGSHDPKIKIHVTAQAAIVASGGRSSKSALLISIDRTLE
ncbi:hypothetical protein [Bradyrhizobium nitroreducens]|uniref:hypothetical protein n=1 Tax=Bradyrhizobium nitroreducens TaxID=709803 RepID=UPI001374B8C2|nr:hypothetical protein [Bradyrhizobium nitroreducens]